MSERLHRSSTSVRRACFLPRLTAHLRSPPALASLAATAITACAAAVTVVPAAHAGGECRATLSIDKRAELPEQSAGGQVHPVVSAEIADQDIFDALQEACGPYHRIVEFRLNRTVTAQSMRIWYFGEDGTRLETHIPQGRTATDDFDGLDPRGRWDLAQFSSAGPIKQTPIGFIITAALPDGFKPDAGQATPDAAGPGEAADAAEGPDAE